MSAPVLPTFESVSANTDFVRGGDTKYVRQLCEWGDSLHLQEHKYADLDANLPPGWTSLQDTTNEATKGSCLAVRDEMFDVQWSHLVLGAAPYWRGRRLGLLPRYIALAGVVHRPTGRGLVLSSAHPPPWRFRVLQPHYTDVLHDLAQRYPRMVIGTDANQPIGALGLRTGLNSYGRGIVGLLTNLPTTNRKVRPWGEKRGLTDHPAITATITVTKEKNK